MASQENTLFSHEDSDTRKDKSPNALRTISEASELLDVPQHVLRFWETKFPQIKPLKRNGGRRFYRPQDLDVLQQIKHLLYSQGYTIKGAKKAVDEFIHARSNDRSVTASEWISQVKPANVNDNFAVHALEEAHDKDMLAELAEALADDGVTATVAPISALPRDELLALRAELVTARDVLRMMIPNAA